MAYLLLIVNTDIMMHFSPISDYFSNDNPILTRIAPLLADARFPSTVVIVF